MKKLFLRFEFALIASCCAEIPSVPFVEFTCTQDAIRFFSPFLPLNPVIVEAGAYDGADSIRLAHGWPRGIVYSFEPVAELYDQLVKTVRNVSNIRTFHAALGGFNGIAILHVSELVQRPGIASQSSSILAPKEHLVYAPEAIFPRQEKVAVTTLDAWAEENHIDHVDFMWLDIQGAAYDALSQSPNIVKTVRALLVEVELVEAYEGEKLAEDVHVLLVSYGFELIGISGRGWFRDFLYARR